MYNLIHRTTNGFVGLCDNTMTTFRQNLNSLPSQVLVRGNTMTSHRRTKYEIIVDGPDDQIGTTDPGRNFASANRLFRCLRLRHD